MGAGVRHQHTQVSAQGAVEAAHVDALLQLLERRTKLPPTVLAVRDTLLHRCDDQDAEALETSDSRWSNVRRERKQTRLHVRTERGLT